MMASTKKNQLKLLGMIILMALSNIGLYGLPYMRNQFYDIMISALQVSHSELSFLFSIFGTVSLLSYILGGPIVDQFSSKTMMCVSLLISGFMHLYALTIPPFQVLCIIFGIMALTSCFTFYPASMKLLNSLENDGGKGKVFGFYVSIIGILGIWVVLIGLAVLNMNAAAIHVFQIVVGSYGILNLLMCILLFIFLKEEKNSTKTKQKMDLSMLPSLLTNKLLWCVAGIMFFNYLNASIMTYLVPFLSMLYELDEKYIIIISVIRTNIITIIASAAAGILTDKMKSAIRLYQVSFLIAGAGSILMLVSAVRNIPLILIIAAAFAITFVQVGAKSVNLVMLSEIKIPSRMFGTAVGIVSFISFSPDAFFYQIAGFILDYCTNPFMILFGVLVISMFAGLLLCRYILE